MIFGTPKPEEQELFRERHTLKPRQDEPQAKNSNAGLRPTYASLPILATSQRANIALESPAKRPGILLTPGTGGARRKTVSFDGHTSGNKRNIPFSRHTASTPRDIPGRYPSPLVPRYDDAAQEIKKPTKLTQTLLHTRDQTALQKKNTAPKASAHDVENQEDVTVDVSAPRSTSGRYWKTEFDSFSSKSTLEVRKLAKKEQLAKSYAKHRDTEATNLAQLLHREQKKVLRLEKQVAEFARQLAAAMAEKPRQDNDQTREQGKPTPRTSSCAVQSSQKDSSAEPPTLRDAQAALQNAEHRNRMLQEANQALQAKLDSVALKPLTTVKQRNMHKTARAIHNTEVLEPGLESKKHGRAPSTTGLGPEKQEPGSDIWADVGLNDQDAERKAGGPTARGKSERRKRPVLMSRDGNASELQGDECHGQDGNATDENQRHPKVATKSGDVIPTKAFEFIERQVTEGGLPVDRREAARRRLAEKRKVRELELSVNVAVA